MSPSQLIFATAALSVPIVTLIAIGRAGVCVFRSQRAKRPLFVFFSVLAILLIAALFSVVIVVWFGYGVAHSGKDASTDLKVLASTVIPIYAGAYAVWRSSRYMESRLERPADAKR